MSLDDLVATHENKLRRNPLSRWHFLAGKLVRRYISLPFLSLFGLTVFTAVSFNNKYDTITDSVGNIAYLHKEYLLNVHGERSDNLDVDDSNVLSSISHKQEVNTDLSSLDVSIAVDSERSGNFLNRFYNKSDELPYRNVPTLYFLFALGLGAGLSYVGIRAVNKFYKNTLESENGAFLIANQKSLEFGLSAFIGGVAASSYLLHGSFTSDETVHVSKSDAIAYIAAFSFLKGFLGFGGYAFYDVIRTINAKKPIATTGHLTKGFCQSIVGKMTMDTNPVGKHVYSERVLSQFVNSLSRKDVSDETRLGYLDALLTYDGRLSFTPDSQMYCSIALYALGHLIYLLPRPSFTSTRLVMHKLVGCKSGKDFFRMPDYFKEFLNIHNSDPALNSLSAELHALHARWLDNFIPLIEKKSYPPTRFTTESIIGMKQAYEKMYDLPSGLSLSEVLERVSHKEWGTAVALAHEDKDASRVLLGSSKNEVYTLGRNSFLRDLIVVKRFGESHDLVGEITKMKDLAELVKDHKQFQVPRIRYHSLNSDEGFVVCEFVHGKTLSEVDTFEAYKLAAEYVAFIHDTMGSERGAKNYRSVARERIQHAHSSSLRELDAQWGFVFDTITGGYVFNADPHPHNWLIGGEGDNTTISAIDVEDMGLVQPEFDMAKLLDMIPHSLSREQHARVIDTYCAARQIDREEFMRSYLHAVIPGAVGFSIYSHEQGFATPSVRAHFLENARRAIYELNTSETRALDKHIVTLQNTLG